MSPLFFAMLFFVFMADGLMAFLTPVVVYQLTGSLEYSGLSYALWWLPRVVVIPLIGRYIDRMGVRPLSVTSDVVKTAGCLFLAFYDFSSAVMVAVAFGVVGSLISIGNSQTLVSYEKIVALISPSREHHVNLISRMDFLGMVAGPLIGMLLIDYGYRSLLLLPCFLYLLNASFFFLKVKKIRSLGKQELKSDVSKTQEFLSLKKSIIFIFSMPILVLTVCLAAGNNMFDGLVESSGAALIERSMGLPVKYFAMVDVAAGLCGVFGTYMYTLFKSKMDRKNIFIFSVLLIVISSIVLIINQSSFLVFIICCSVSITGKVFTGNIFRMIRIEFIRASIFASTSSVIVLLNQSVLPVVGMLIYFSKDSTYAVYFFMSVAVAITFVAGLLLYRMMKAVSGTSGAFPPAV